MATVLLFIGVAICLVGGIWLLVVAFQESIWWGIGSLLLPIVGLIFVILHWQEAKKPFLIQLGGVAFMILGIVLGGRGEPGIE